jgi:hypothetical protein
MNIQEITTDALRKMADTEGLVIQGCGGDLREWVDGINRMLTDYGVFSGGGKFETALAFRHEGRTCLLFPFDGVRLDGGKLAAWRLMTHGEFGGTWLSDFVPNRLGGFLEARAEKPLCPLIGKDGNIFHLTGMAARTLREHGRDEQAREMRRRVFSCGSYPEALGIIGEYVEITDAEGMAESHSPQLW